ncbi:MAG: glycosyltransferase family 4 protein [Fibrobacterota bacterium]
MKVLTLTHVFPRSRADTVAPFLWNFHEALAQQNIDAVVCAPHEKHLPRTEEYPHCRVERFRYAPQKFERLAYKGNMHELVLSSTVNKVLFLSYLICGFFSLCRLIRREKPDLVHVHWWIPSGIIMYCASFLFKTPYIITSHGTDVFILKRFTFLSFFARKIFRQATRIHAISTYVKDEILSLVPEKKDSIDIISMPIREERIPQKPPRFRGGKKLLFLGRLIPRKGADILISALSELSEEYELTLVGTGPEKDRLCEACRKHAVSDRVNFRSTVSPDALPGLFEEHEIFILPSRTDWKAEKEGLGMVLLEAQRMGLALIASDSGGMPDIVIHEKTGLLVPENDPHALALAIQKYTDASFYKTMVLGAQTHYTKNYSQNSLGEKTRVSYENVVKSHS